MEKGQSRLSGTSPRRSLWTRTSGVLVGVRVLKEAGGKFHDQDAADSVVKDVLREEAILQGALHKKKKKKKRVRREPVV